eukprot:COSAG01_NODE_214_length_21729_cov_684.831623_3_plen_742_part_00
MPSDDESASEGVDEAELEEKRRRQEEARRMLQIWDVIATLREPESGELRSQIFMALPSRIQYPDYYNVITNPIALNPIRRKIETLKYASMDEFESDLMVLFNNARAYNAPDSVVYADAEAMQQAVLNFLGRKHLGAEPTTTKELWLHVRVGFMLDARDARGHWYKAKIVEMDVGRIKVHYQGWNAKWNAWHEKGGDDLLPLGTHTGAKVKANKNAKGAQYKCVRGCDVRESHLMNSRKCGALKSGEIAVVVEQRTNASGQVRVCLESPCVGWTSIVSRDGVTLLEPISDADGDRMVAKKSAAEKKAQEKEAELDWEKNGVPGVSCKCTWYAVKDGETPRDVAKKHGMRVCDIVFLNKRLYSGLTELSKLKGGTKLRMPESSAEAPEGEEAVHKPAPKTDGKGSRGKKGKDVAAAAAAAKAPEIEKPVWYKALNDETPKIIAAKLGVAAVDLVAVNRPRYDGLTQTSRLMAGTKLRVPRPRQAGELVRSGAVGGPLDDDWIGGSEVVAYRHWTFPNDPIEFSYPSYMMARKLVKRTPTSAAAQSAAGEAVVSVSTSKRGKAHAKGAAAPSKEDKKVSLLAHIEDYLHEPVIPGTTASSASATEDSTTESTAAAVTAAKAAEMPAKMAAEEPSASEAEDIMQKCLKAVLQVKEAETGRLLCHFFKTLPSRADFPDYFRMIDKPISLHMIGQRINKDEYRGSLEEFATDMKTLCDNARQYNDPQSQIYQVMKDVAVAIDRVRNK